VAGKAIGSAITRAGSAISSAGRSLGATARSLISTGVKIEEVTPTPTMAGAGGRAGAPAVTSTTRSAKSGAALQTKTTATNSTPTSMKGLSPNEKGVKGEEWVRIVTRMEKYKGDPIRGRKPDFFDPVRGLLIESKNVRYQGLSRQLKDYMIIAKENGVQMQLYVRHSTKISKALRESGIIIKRFPW